MSRCVLRIGTLLASGLLACDLPPAADHHRQASAVGALPTGISAHGIRSGITTPSGQRQELEIETVEPLEGRIAGLRAPILDGLTLRGVRVTEQGVEVLRAARLDLGPWAGLRRRVDRDPLPKDLEDVVDALRHVLELHPAPAGLASR